MGFWDIVWMLCQFPLGVASMFASVIIGMVAFLGCSFICYCLWCMIIDRCSDKYKIFGRKWEDD